MPKLLKIFETKHVKKIKEWKKLLEEGKLLEVEEAVQLLLRELFVKIMGYLLTEAGTSSKFKKKLEGSYKEQGVGQLRQRKNRIQLITGDWVSYKSYYARSVSKGTTLATRHLSELYWGCVKGASVGYASLLSIYSVMCPSFEVGAKILGLHSIQVTASRMRKVGIGMGELGQKIGIRGILKDGETLQDKRVVVSFDGGRSRTREANGKRNKKGNAQFDTPWKEPKIIVIQVLNETGEVERKKSIPFYYGTMKSTNKAMKKMEEALILLGADKASILQFISDGALSIWRNIKKVIRRVGIAFSKVVFTLDYYHGVEHLKELSKMLPEEEKKQKVVFEEWKEMLWEGLANSIARDFKKRIKKAGKTLTEEMETAIAYFFKHHDHMQYKQFKRRKLLCGSGLVESAVRRIINLRFKGPSTFWEIGTLENLILLRCVFLAGRWDNLLKNIQLHLKNCGTI